MGGLGEGRIRVDHSPGAQQDFGQGFYLAVGQGKDGVSWTQPGVGPGRNGVEVAEAFGNVRVTQRQTGPRQVLAWEVRRSDLGDVVDVRPGGEHAEAWSRYLNQPIASGLKMTIGEYIRGTGVEHRGEYFERFLQSIGKQNADVVIGPIGTPETSGVVSQPGTQLSIRSQRVADRLNKMMGGGSGTGGPGDKSGPATPPSNPPTPGSGGAKTGTASSDNAAKTGKASVLREGSGTSVYNPKPASKPVSKPLAEPPFSEGELVVIESYIRANKTRAEAEQLVRETRGPENEITVLRPNTPNSAGVTRGPDGKNPGSGKKRP
jgi:hypothetical protein